MSLSQISREFAAGRNCAQCILGCWADVLGLDRADADAIAGCFGGGADTGNLCGAVTGAYMVIGLHCGEEHSAAIEMSGKFRDRFRAEFGSLDCSELLGFDMSDPKEKARAKASGVIAEHCPGYVKAALDILAELTLW